MRSPASLQLSVGCRGSRQDAPAQLGGAEWPGVEPLGCPAEGGDAHMREHGHLAQGPEPRANLVAEQLRLLPSREVPALVELVVMDELGVCGLRPTLRR